MKVVSVGYNLLPALLSKKVDAVIGVYRNVEGIELERRGLKPTVIPLDRAGVPTYDELVLVASASRIRSDPEYASTAGRFVRAFLAGSAAARNDPKTALAVLGKATAADKSFLARATPATLALLSTPQGVGCLSLGEWRMFGAWMQATSLLEKRVPASTAMTVRFLPSRCRQ